MVTISQKRFDSCSATPRSCTWATSSSASPPPSPARTTRSHPRRRAADVRPRRLGRPALRPRRPHRTRHRLARLRRSRRPREIRPGARLHLRLRRLAAIGLPVSANFVGEVFVFLAAFQQYTPATGLGPCKSPASSPSGAWSSPPFTCCAPTATSSKARPSMPPQRAGPHPRRPHPGATPRHPLLCRRPLPESASKSSPLITDHNRPLGR
jgi:hypothetical protein